MTCVCVSLNPLNNPILCETFSLLTCDPVIFYNSIEAFDLNNVDLNLKVQSFIKLSL